MYMAFPVPTRFGSDHDDPYSATSPRFENDVVNLAAFFWDCGYVGGGLAVGLAVGVAVGLAVGFVVGLAAGLAVGLAVGVAVGLAVWLAVGLAVGLTVGFALRVWRLRERPS